MTERNKGKLKAADIIAEMVHERLDEVIGERPHGRYSMRAAYEKVLDDIRVYQMIVTKSDRYGPIVDQQEPGMDY
tara:strand:+ start:181 stop:405 length:225 start_codon:yes stop_codon:yes gene_type:complete